MENREEESNSTLKRQREPLSDSDDNSLSAQGTSDGQKRRRLERAGQENQSPKPTSSGRKLELETKPDTPSIPSVRSRVLQLTQRREGGHPLVPRCFSHPGSDDNGLKGHLLGEQEFRQRMERFKASGLSESPASMSSSSNPSPRTRSDFVTLIQQKFQDATTPRSQEAARLRKEREEELNRLNIQPISENPLMKRSNSDPSLAQVQEEADMKDGSLTDDSTSAVNTMGEKEPREALSESVEVEPINERQKKSPQHDSEEVGEAEERKASAESEIKCQPKNPIVVTLSFSSDQSLVESAPDKELVSVSESTMTEVFKESEVDSFDGFSFGEDQQTEGSSYGEEAIEPSTDEELRVWRYPEFEVYEYKEPQSTEEKMVSIEKDERQPNVPKDNLKRSEESSELCEDVELSSTEQNTSEMIDQMFGEVLECAERMEEEGRKVEKEETEDRDSGIEAYSAHKPKVDTETEKQRNKEEEDGSKEQENTSDELLTFPPAGILSPLSKSIEAAVTPLRLAASQESNPPPPVLLSPEGNSTSLAESAPLYSIDAYRTQRQRKPPTAHSVTPGLQSRTVETSKNQTPLNSKERITALNEEAGKLQTVISQTLQALNCCTDEEHGRGSLEEAEAEKLLLVSCEKRSTLLAEVTRLREERGSESGEAAGEDRDDVSQQPCRGSINITNIRLPLKVEFVCSSHGCTGRPSHYFFILIRYPPCNLVATPLATAADAQNGDTITFHTTVTLNDIRSSFEIDIEVYSLSHTSGSNSSVDRASTKSRVTPRKLLSTITRSNNTLTSASLPAVNTRRTSNFCLVGSHKISLASLGLSKFPLDKMKLEGKIRRLLGDEFQEKVPFLSPLEGNIYLQLDSKCHSTVQHQGFLTMFELVSGFGVWNRRYFVLEGYSLKYWNHPNDKEAKEAVGSVSLSSYPNHCVRPVKRDLCARPFTFELLSDEPLQESDSLDSPAKSWFSADTKQERLDWMENLRQALLDFHTWNRIATEGLSASCSTNLRESIL